MILKYKEEHDIEESMIDIVARPNDEVVARVLQVIEPVRSKLLVDHNDRTTLLDKKEICYVESVESQIFVYTINKMYETKYKLYELEEELSGNFVRISKSVIVNLLMVETITPDMGSRLILELENKEKLIVNRTYVKEIKRKLNMR